MVVEQSMGPHCTEADVAVESLRDEISKLERKRRRFQLQAEQREADLQDEVARLISEKQKLAAELNHTPPPALGLERPLRLAEENLRLADENRSLRAEQERLTTELRRLAAEGSNKCMREAEAGEHLALPAESEFKLDAASQTEADDSKSADVSFQEASTQSEVSCCSVSTQCETDDEKDSPTNMIGSQASITNNSTEPTGFENEHCQPDQGHKHESYSSDVVSRSELQSLRVELAEWRQTCAKLAEDQKALLQLGSPKELVPRILPNRSQALHRPGIPVARPSGAALQQEVAAEAISQSATPEATATHTLNRRRATSPEAYQTEIRSCLLELARVRGGHASADSDGRWQSTSQPQKPRDERLPTASCIEDPQNLTAAKREFSLQPQAPIDVREAGVPQRRDQLVDMHEHSLGSPHSLDMRREGPQPLRARQRVSLQPPEPMYNRREDMMQPPEKINVKQANAVDILDERPEFNVRSPEPLDKSQERTSQPPQTPVQQQDSTLQPQEPVDGRQQGTCTLQPAEPPDTRHESPDVRQSSASPAPDQQKGGQEDWSQKLPPLNFRGADSSQTLDQSEERGSTMVQRQKLEAPEALDVTPVAQPPKQQEGASQPFEILNITQRCSSESSAQLAKQLDPTATADSPPDLWDVGQEPTIQPQEPLDERQEGNSQQREQPDAQDEANFRPPKPADAREAYHLQPDEATLTSAEARDTSQGFTLWPSSQLGMTEAVPLQPENPLEMEAESAGHPIDSLDGTQKETTLRAQELLDEKHRCPLQQQGQPCDWQEGNWQQREPLGEQRSDSIHLPDSSGENPAGSESVDSEIDASNEEEGRETSQGLGAMRPTPLDLNASPLASFSSTGSWQQELPGRSAVGSISDGLQSSPPTRRSLVTVHQPVTPETPNTLIAMRRVESDGNDSSSKVSSAPILRLTKPLNAEVATAATATDDTKTPDGKLEEDVRSAIEAAAPKMLATLESEMSSLDSVAEIPEASIKGEDVLETKQKLEESELHHIKPDSPRSSCDFSGGIGWLDEVWPDQESECIRQLRLSHPDSTPTRIERPLTLHALSESEENAIDVPSNSCGQPHPSGQWTDAHTAEEDGVLHAHIHDAVVDDESMCSEGEATLLFPLRHNSPGGNLLMKPSEVTEEEAAGKACLIDQHEVNDEGTTEDMYRDSLSNQACTRNESSTDHATLVLPLGGHGWHGGEEEQAEDEETSESSGSSEVSAYSPISPDGRAYRRAKTWAGSQAVQVHQPNYLSDAHSGPIKNAPADQSRKRESSREKDEGAEDDFVRKASSCGADTRRSSSLEPDGKRPRHDSEGNAVLSRFTPQHANSQLTLGFQMDREKKSDSLSLTRERCPLIDAFLVIDTQARKRTVTDGAGRHAGLEEGSGPNFVRQRWPENIEGSRLEKALVADGFCPGPLDGRFRGEAFAFTMLETNTDPHGDPNGILYCCVCSEDQTLPADPAEPGDGFQENSPKSHQQDRGRLAGGVLCLVSKLPLLGFYFKLLGLLRSNLGKVEAILDCVQNTRLEHLAEQGLLLSDLKGSQTLIELRHLPQPPLCDGCAWSDLTGIGALEPLSAGSQTMARWAVTWGLNVLFSRWEGLVEVIKDLLPTVLLEQKVLLLGDIQRISVVAMLLRSMIWPFRWLHLFLSAPPPEECLNIPFLEGCFPMILAMGELPDSWGCESVRQLPAEVITAMLLHDWVYTSPQLETIGGLKGEKIKLPGNMQAEFRKQASQARIYLRKGQISISEAVSKVQTAAETGVGKLASLVRRYAECRIAAQEAVGAEVPIALFRQNCFTQAMDSDTFLKWLEAEGELDLSSSSDSVSFYRTFIQTQLCLDFLNEEIMSQTAGFSPD